MFFNTLMLAVRDIKRNVMRSVLTILGIIIGVGSVITMVTIGSGTTIQVTGQIAEMGSNVLLIMPGKRMGPIQTSRAPLFDIKDTYAIENDVASITAIAPVCTHEAIAVVGNQNWATLVVGSTREYFDVRSWDLAAGRIFEESEVLNGQTVCLVGSTICKNLFDGDVPLDRTIRLGNVSCRIIGVLTSKGQSTIGIDQDDLIILPLPTVQRRFTGNNDVSLIEVSVKEGHSTSKVASNIDSLMRERRHLSVSQENDFSIMDMTEVSDMFANTTKVMTAMLSAVAGVSLLVGGIGIMNIMLVSVTERTREIGIRMAIGAMEHEVMMQFLVEAVVLASFGGLIGIILALAGSFWLTILLNIPFIINVELIVMAFVFSAAVGVIFGYFPALKAARLNPIDALRHE